MQDEFSKITFTRLKAPYQLIIPVQNVGKLLLFLSGKCRLMGLKHPFSKDIQLPLKIYNMEIQSLTVTYNVGFKINILELARRMPPREHMYEPELFPALRLTKFNPVCVNVFSSGKIVILGLRELAYQNILNSFDQELREYIPKSISL